MKIYIYIYIKVYSLLFMTKQHISVIKLFLHNYILFHIGLFNAYLTFCCLNQHLHSLASVITLNIPTILTAIFI